MSLGQSSESSSSESLRESSVFPEIRDWKRNIWLILRLYHLNLGTYLITNLGYIVEPNDVKNKEDAEEAVKDVVDRKHLDKLEKKAVAEWQSSALTDLSSINSGGVNDPGGEDTKAGVRPGEQKYNVGDVATLLKCWRAMEN